MRPAVVFNLVAAITGVQATYCSDKTPDLDWCWNDLVYGRCQDNKLVWKGDCDYKTKRICTADNNGASCMSVS